MPAVRWRLTEPRLAAAATTRFRRTLTDLRLAEALAISPAVQMLSWGEARAMLPAERIPLWQAGRTIQPVRQVPLLGVEGMTASTCKTLGIWLVDWLRSSPVAPKTRPGEVILGLVGGS